MKHVHLFVCLALLTLPGCESEKDDPGFDAAKPVQALTAAEYDAFCDWAAAKLGGAGKVVTCPLVEDPSRVVTLTVDDALSCKRATRPVCDASAYKTCFDALAGALCNVKDEPACAAFRLCVPDWPMMDYLIHLSPPAPANGPSGDSFWR